MELDQTTLADLSVFNREEEYSVFGHLNYTRTNGGRDKLEEIFRTPLKTPEAIVQTQTTLRYIQQHLENWPSQITNGTVMVLDKFLEATEDDIPLHEGPLGRLHALYYRLFMSPAYSLIHYSLSHIYTFLREMHTLTEQFNEEGAPPMLRAQLRQASHLLDRREIRLFLKAQSAGNLSIGKTIRFGHFLRYRHRNTLYKLMAVYYCLDAWHSMAFAVEKRQFSFPEFEHSDQPVLAIEQLYHPLLKNPVAYDIRLDNATNFLFLTGANMAGKSTFIKAIGLSTYLAHLGMGVPARKMRLSFFEGLLSNIQVQDNIFLGESYFYNEVQRIKKTIVKINDGRKWLILIDEMFKGTNFQDAKQCSIMVIEGLLKMKDSLFVLSTHLYEIAESLNNHKNITFRYFETAVENEEPQYSYQLKEGISNDRLGFLILKRENVLDLLEKIGEGFKQSRR